MMVGQSLKLQRRAALTALLASLVFLASLAAFAAANRISYAALNPSIDLHPLLERLRRTSPPILRPPIARRGGAHAALNFPFGAPPLVDSVYGPEGLVFVLNGRTIQAGYQRVLEDFVPDHRETAGAMIAGLNGRIWAAYPGRDELGGQSLQPSTRDGTPAPYFADPSAQDPQIEGGAVKLLQKAQFPGRSELLGGIRVEPLYDSKGSFVGRLFVLVRPKQPAYEFATYYMLPISGTGAAVSLLLYWLMLPWWVYLDARARTEKAVPLAVFVLLTNFLGWLTYLVIRPDTDRLCPACVSLMEPGFRCCPHCGWRRAARCHGCGRPTHSDWRFCPYCETPLPEGQQAGDGILPASAAPGRPPEAGAEWVRP